MIDLVLFVLNLRGKYDFLEKNLPFLTYCLAHYLNRILYQPKYAPPTHRNYHNIKASAQGRLSVLGVTKYPLLAIWLPIVMDHLSYKFHIPLLFLVDLTALHAHQLAESQIVLPLLPPPLPQLTHLALHLPNLEDISLKLYPRRFGLPLHVAGLGPNI